jgi:5'(3')-deoxyribonucleotidase
MTPLPDVLFDVDGVFGDFITPALAEVTKLTGIVYRHDDVTQWDIMASLGVPDDIARQAYDNMRREGFCHAIPVYPGAVEGFAALKDVCNPYIVTAPLGGPHWAHEREMWLYDHFGIKRKNIISTSAKHKCAGAMLIDDKTSHLVEWQNAHPRGCAVRWESLSNSTEAWNGVKTNDWRELRGIIIGLRVGLTW